MSEYQYYEFQAIDWPLTAKEMSELRSYSSRARITSTRFVNDYARGSFKGDEDAWMEKYFDAFLYLANWGTRVLKLRLPSRLLESRTAKRYCGGGSAFVREKRLDSLAGRESKLWSEVDSLVATSQPNYYDRAVAILVDLRELASRDTGGDFRLRLEALRQVQARKPSFIERLRKAGL